MISYRSILECTHSGAWHSYRDLKVENQSDKQRTRASDTFTVTARHYIKLLSDLIGKTSRNLSFLVLINYFYT